MIPVSVKLRDLNVHVTLPERSPVSVPIAVEYFLVNQDGDYLVNQDGDFLTAIQSEDIYPRRVHVKIRKFEVWTKVGE